MVGTSGVKVCLVLVTCCLTLDFHFQETDALYRVEKIGIFLQDHAFHICIQLVGIIINIEKSAPSFLLHLSPSLVQSFA
jgi:hypothetical protein